MKLELLQRKQDLLMISWESKETSKRSIIEECNKKNKNSIMISVNIKRHMSNTKRLLSNSQLIMKQQSKRRCWWSSKRIDWLLRLRILKTISSRLKRTSNWNREKKMKYRRDWKHRRRSLMIKACLGLREIPHKFLKKISKTLTYMNSMNLLTLIYLWLRHLKDT